MQHPTNKRRPTRAASSTNQRPKWRPDLELDPKCPLFRPLLFSSCRFRPRLAHRIHRQRCALECRRTTELLAAHNGRPNHHKIAHQLQHQTPPKPEKKKIPTAIHRTMAALFVPSMPSACRVLLILHLTPRTTNPPDISANFTLPTERATKWSLKFSTPKRVFHRTQ
uniref:(northern house mosquito) hypothetical protein n=1 Tax=Culex pipiens TaxID=7175 RepID=A0A8D8ACS6_CULPI